MAAARLLQVSAAEPTISEAIQIIPVELLEMILKQHITIKMKERTALSWYRAHKELLYTPFCQERETLGKVKFCLEHGDCEVEGLCKTCHYWTLRNLRELAPSV